MRNEEWNRDDNNIKTSSLNILDKRYATKSDLNNINLSLRGPEGAKGDKGDIGAKGDKGDPGFTPANLGTGAKVFKDTTTLTANFRTLVAGSNINISETSDTLTITAVDSGGAYSMINVGLGAGLFKELTTNVFKMKTLVAGDNITLTQNDNDITINSSGGGGTGDVTASGDNIFTGFNTFANKTSVNDFIAYSIIDTNSTGIFNFRSKDEFVGFQFTQDIAKTVLRTNNIAGYLNELVLTGQNAVDNIGTVFLKGGTGSTEAFVKISSVNNPLGTNAPQMTLNSNSLDTLDYISKKHEFYYKDTSDILKLDIASVINSYAQFNFNSEAIFKDNITVDLDATLKGDLFVNDIRPYNAGKINIIGNSTNGIDFYIDSDVVFYADTDKKMVSVNNTDTGTTEIPTNLLLKTAFDYRGKIKIGESYLTATKPNSATERYVSLTQFCQLEKTGGYNSDVSSGYVSAFEIQDGNFTFKNKIATSTGGIILDDIFRVTDSGSVIASNYYKGTELPDNELITQGALDDIYINIDGGSSASTYGGIPAIIDGGVA